MYDSKRHHSYIRSIRCIVEHFLASPEAQHLVTALRATEGELDVRHLTPASLKRASRRMSPVVLNHWRLILESVSLRFYF
jgi:hypothetical protein